MLAPNGDRAVPALSILVVNTTRLYCIVRLMLAPSGDRAVPASLFFFIFVGVIGRCQLLCCYPNACSKWRQGGARIV